jgi:hypothetical protein
VYAAFDPLHEHLGRRDLEVDPEVGGLFERRVDRVGEDDDVVVAQLRRVISRSIRVSRRSLQKLEAVRAGGRRSRIGRDV